MTKLPMPRIIGMTPPPGNVLRTGEDASESRMYVIITMPTHVSRNGRYSRLFFVMPCQARRG